MHQNEKWQEFYRSGERVKNGGDAPIRDSKIENLFGAACVEFYRVKNDKIEFLFQKRSEKIDGYPGWWDLSAGGHINYEEPITAAAVREAKEEIGIKIDPEKLEFACFYARPSEMHHNLIAIYFYRLDEETEFVFDDHEVSEVKWVTEEDLPEFWKKLKPPVAKDPFFKIALEEKIANLQRFRGV